MKRSALLFLGLLVVSCGGGGGGGGGGGPTLPPPNQPALAFTAASAPSANSILLTSGAGSTADRLFLEVRANQVTDLYGVAFDLSYPTNVLRYVGKTAGTFLDGSVQASEAPPGNLVAGASRLGSVAGANGSGLILTFEFTAIGPGSGSFAFSRNTAVNSSGAPLPGSSFVAGTVQVTR